MWQRWKNRTICALDGSGYEQILSEPMFAQRNSNMNKIVYSQLSVATVDGTAHHIVMNHAESKMDTRLGRIWFNGMREIL